MNRIPFIGFLSALCLSSLFACAPIRRAPAVPPYTPQETASLIQMIQRQQREARTFFASGQITVRRFPGSYESGVLMVGERNPPDFKIEVTHGYGQPVLYVLIEGQRVQVLSFSDRKLYYGRFGDPALARYLPGLLGPDEAVSILRTFPALLPHEKAVSLKPYQISLLNDAGEAIEVIDFYPDSGLPRLLSFPGKDVRIAYGDFQSASDGLLYARSIEIKDGLSAELKLKQMTFNRPIPAAIFQLEVPPSFERVPLR